MALNGYKEPILALILSQFLLDKIEKIYYIISMKKINNTKKLGELVMNETKKTVELGIDEIEVQYKTIFSGNQSSEGFMIRQAITKFEDEFISEFSLNNISHHSFHAVGGTLIVITIDGIRRSI